MFKPARMQKLKIITLDKYADSAVTSLHEAGIVQIHDISERIQQDAQWRQILKPSRATPYTAKISSLLMKTTSIVDFLSSVTRKEGGILNLIKGFINPPSIKKHPVKLLSTEELIKSAEDLLNTVESKTKKFEDRLSELDAERTELENASKTAANIINLDLDLSLLEESKYTNKLVGRMDKDSFSKFQEDVQEITDQLVILESPDEDKTSKTIIIITLKDYAEEVSSLLRKLEFERFEISGLSGKPKEIIQEVQIRTEALQKEKEEILDKLADIAQEWGEQLQVLKEQLEIEKDRNEIFSSFGETENTVMFEGWVTSKKVDKALEMIDEATEGHSVVEVSEPDGPMEDIPIHLDNPRFAKPYELFVEMYSPPTYKEFDPTILVAIVFPFFFGFCLTDAGYGILDALIGFVVYRGLGKNSKTLRNMGLILIACGVWSFILGMITNGMLGDFFPRFFTGSPIPSTIAAFDAFVNPQNILIAALLVGVIHINIGLIIGAYNNIKIGEVKEALGSQIVWIILEAGIVLYLLTGSLIVGGIPVAISLALLLYINGFFGIMDITGFLGTLLSYARLLALCLSTGGIAMTVNILTGLSAEMIPYLGVIIAPIIFIGGHLANCAFQSLGAFINSLRLHYVEFFAQFYIGGSSKFRPFRAKRRFTKIE